jgi:drug/metabolite transporter (DMT)-like permease
LAALVLGEQVRARRLTALAVGFVGVIIVVRPGFRALHVGQVLVLLDSFFWAISIILLRIATRTDPPHAIVAYMFLLVLPISAVPACFVWSWPSVHGWGLVLAIAVSSTIGHYCSTRAFALTEATVLTPFDYLRLIWFTAGGYLVFGEVPDDWALLGACVIAASSLYLILREHELVRRRRRRAEPPADP